ncbi:hypothetical protein SPI_08566 [Niveomyces insectorum RCEF 264]|uniref:Uncharacterized protein n=1 Tax=Niveomyces insectorum RCEF 264 TaxID=1081102 RepID=A0A167N2W3_9HYPO|nr:hypothetical protein SPI_08566 [Niveomyces insectorum RCEF 264]
MATNVTNRESQESKSTATFSAPDSADIPSSVIAPNPAHHTVPPADSQAAQSSAHVLGRWSDGTFGQHSIKSAAASVTAESVTSEHTTQSANATDSASYSGQSAEATTAAAATAQVVTIGRVQQKGTDSEPRTGADITSGDFVDILGGMEESVLTIIRSTGESA